jgi:hypothetical protein
VTYTAEKPPLPVPLDDLRARIPGWGVDADPADRPSVPRERFDPGATGAHWLEPEQQPELYPRERSIEHERLTPVFGTSTPPRGLSGRIRRHAYARYSEARAAHWLLLLGADRVDAAEQHVRALVSGRPDPILETGLRSEVTAHGLSSRIGEHRADVRHQPVDQLIAAAPWIAIGTVGFIAARRVARSRQPEHDPA